MIEELVSANQALDAALTRYLRACTNVKVHYARRMAEAPSKLMARLDTEASSLTSFETRLKESHAAIHFARTYHINPSAPISTLPAEILAHIFSMTVAQVRRTLERTLHQCLCDNTGPLSSNSNFHATFNYPDILSHVCSSWRRTAINSRSLWASIDISTLKSSKMNVRAKEHIDRAGQSLLNLYIYDIDAIGAKRIDPIPDLVPPSARIQSLHSHTHYPPSDKVCRLTLSSAISKSKAGVLTELVLQQYGWDADIPAAFIEADSNPAPGIPPITSIEDTEILWLQVPKQHLENILLGISILRCYEVYPYWTSQAYCGLTELRLMIPHWTGTGVDEADFINMLKSSPNLRVLELNRHITNFSTGPIAESNRIHLSKLEVLSLRWLWNDQTETVLRWLSPIANPLQISISCQDNEEGDIDFTTGGTKAFLTKSNVTKFHIAADHYDEPVVNDLLSLGIRTLAVEGLSRSDLALPETRIRQSQLDTLYLLNGSFEIPRLRQFLEPITIRRIIFHRSSFDILEQEVPSALSGICADVLVMSEDELNPIADWELFTPRPTQGTY